MADRQDVIAPSPARMLFESTTPTDDPLRELPPTTGAITPTGRHTSSVTRNFKLAKAQFFRGRSDSGPSTNRPTRRRGSPRANRTAIRAIGPSNSSCRRAGSTL